jgi:DNA-binding NtrC family response regulator
LIIDDDTDFTARLARGLESDYEVECLGGADAAVLERLAAGEFFAVLLDNYLQGSEMSGLEFLQLRQKRAITVPVILMTGYGDLKTVIAAKTWGAFDYVQKRAMDELLKELKQLLARVPELVPPVAVPGIKAPEAPNRRELIGPSLEMSVFKQIAQATQIAQPVLIEGEAGTGKNLVAWAIHANGPRRDKPFVEVRCHPFNDDLLRDELFGHEIGYRGEGKLRKGKIEYASGGTLYLDDVDALPRALQDDVLRVLEERQVTRLGDYEPIPVDVRVVAASRHDLLSLPESKFRRELHDHLACETITLPPLRERADDLGPLVDYFLQQEAAPAGKPIPTLAAECWGRLRAHSWPGNVRELQTVVRKAVVACRGPQILAEDLVPDEPNAELQIRAGLRIAISSALSSTQTHLYDMLRDLLRKELVVLTLEKCQGNAREAETRLGVSLDHLLHPGEEHPDGEPPLPPDLEWRIRALVLIEAYPEWTVEQYAEKLGCPRTKLYKNSYTRLALRCRGGH